MTDEPTATAQPAPVKRRVVMGSVDVALGAGLIAGTFGLLPIRWWPIDALGACLGLALIVAGAMLLRAHPLAERVAKFVASGVLAVGLLLVASLAFTVGNLAGLYGPVGKGGALLLGVVTLLLLPYLVLLPAAQVYFLLPRDR